MGINKDFIINGSALIAFFMGAVIDPDTEHSIHGPTYVYPENPDSYNDSATLRYDKKWFLGEYLKPLNDTYYNCFKWLLPVCFKFETSLKYDDPKFESHVTNLKRCIAMQNTNALFRALIKAITWHNKKTKTN